MELINAVANFYDNDPQLGDMVFLQNKFDNTTVRGEVVGLERINAQRGLSENQDYEVVLYTGLLIKIGGLDLWLDFEDWSVTDFLRGAEYKKLPPEVVKANQDNLDD